jgi:N-acetylneuraminate synthase/sialic acid synthase
MRSLTIAGHVITQDGPAFTIAEVGNNHQGDLFKAEAMFQAARAAGFDAVKLQKRDIRSLYTQEMYDSPYTSEAAFGPTYGLHREALEFGRDAYVQLKDEARRLGLILFATAFDPVSARFLTQMGMPCFKVASGDLKNIPLLKLLAGYGKPLIVSTGGGSLEDVKRMYDCVMPINDQLAILQCTAAYPAGADVLHLRVIETYLKEFSDVLVGLSDHHARTDMAPAAYALGARIFEKHVTMDRTWKGTDHAFSLEPREQEEYIEGLRRTYLAMGSGEKRPLPIEEKPIYKMGKAVYATQPIAVGERITEENTALKSPAAGLSPHKWEKFANRRAKMEFGPDEPLSSGGLE